MWLPPILRIENMKPIILTWLLLAASSAAPAQTPQVAEGPAAFRIGNSGDFDGQLMTMKCRHWENKRLEANHVGISQCDDKLLHLDTTTLNPIRALTLKGELLVEFRPFYQSLSFPLFVGKKWHSQYSGFRADKNRKWDSRLECEAKRHEKIRVRAGEFDAFRVECTDNWESGHIFSGKVRTIRWFAPAVGMVVKYESEDSDWNYELAGYTTQSSGGANSR